MIIFLFGGYSGGIANYVINIISNLEMDYKICCPKSEKVEFEQVFDKNKLLIFNTKNKSFVVLINDLFKLKKSLSGYDNFIIHAHALRFGMISLIFKLLFSFKTKIIYTDHGSPHTHAPSFLKKVFCFFSEFFVNIFSSQIICIRKIEFNFWKTFIIFNSKINFIKTQISLTLLTKKNTSSNFITIAMIGKIYSLKNPELFKEISMLKFDTSKKLNFKWIGPGNPDIFNDLSPTNNFEYLGSLAYEEMKNLWPKIDILLLTSKSEVLPLIAIEAMNFRSLVIANNYYGVEELIKHYKNGFIFKNSNEAKMYIEKVVNQPVLMNKVIDFAQQEVLQERTDVDSFRNEYINLYLKEM